ncbi:MAG TPA: T9SS type A sorting domain-containing protein [Haliscomenobacter sp.]|uniref:T9SS type A sorting domain-containing protein n=1 Tax=Haliscomenobacter sp. TaxID=2717303 RepID=UPI002CF024A1|nr:T9SS type A sorting domain-containing protein [Haliscomenobacter sp.]HOY20311.1 T9SS type A sorting domain-containing protein [Haliscomenobacter sp.]
MKKKLYFVQIVLFTAFCAVNTVSATPQCNTCYESKDGDLFLSNDSIVVSESFYASSIGSLLNNTFGETRATNADLPTVCDFGGTFLAAESPKVKGRLDNNQISASLANEPCIEKFFGNKTAEELYGEVFVINHLGGALTAEWAADNPNTKAFFFKCTCRGQICTQSCIVEDGSGINKETGEKGVTVLELDPGFYYVVLISDSPTDFQFSLTACFYYISKFNDSTVVPKGSLRGEPCGPCLTNNPILLTCDKPLNGTLSGQGDEFRRNRDFVYANCADGTRLYQGEDLVHKFTLTVPSRISILLNGSAPLGMFLYTQECGENCIASAENNPAGGSASIGILDLDPGEYYVIVDNELSVGTQNNHYFLSLNCETDQSPDYLYDEQICPTSTSNPHVLRIQAIGALLMDNLSLGLNDKISFVYDKGQQNYILASSQNWKTQGLTFNLYEDLPNDKVKCGYTIGEDFSIRVIKNETNYQVNPIFTSNVVEKFSPGITSTIKGFKSMGRSTNLRVNTPYKEMESSPGAFKVLVQSNMNWQIRGLGSWLGATRGTGESDDELFVYLLSSNPSSKPRIDTILLLGENQELRRIIVLQKGCTEAVVDLPESFSVCQGERVTLAARGTGNYLWGNNSMDSTFSFTANVLGATTYSVASTVAGCTASDQVTVRVNPMPSVIKESINPAFGSTGYIQVIVSGGTPDYKFQWFRNDTLISTQEDLIDLKSGIHKLIVTDANGCTATFGPELIMLTVTSSKDISNLEQLDIFPNPSNGQLLIKGKLVQSETVQVRIMDAMGRQLWKSDIKKLKSFEYRPDLSTFKAGTYIIQLNVDDKLLHRKLIVL